MTFKEFLERALAAIKGKFTRQQRRQAERLARKQADRKPSPSPSPGQNRATRRKATKNRDAKHTRRYRLPNGQPLILHATQTPPWKKRARNRRRNEIAAASRRANRPTR